MLPQEVFNNSPILNSIIDRDNKINHLKDDLNYFIVSKSKYLNALTIFKLLNTLTNSVYCPKINEIDSFMFNSYKNVYDFECNNIQNRFLGNIEKFICKSLLRCPLLGDKHIIVLRNFDCIAPKFQDIYKCILKKHSLNSVFIISTIHPIKIDIHIQNFCCQLRVPFLRDNELFNIVKDICILKSTNFDSKYTKSLIKSSKNDVYTILCKLNEYIERNDDSLFEDLFEIELNRLFNFIKKSKSFLKVTEKVRNSMNKILHYNIPDGFIYKNIINNSLKTRSLLERLHEVVQFISDKDRQIVACSKKIFVYEQIYIRLFQLMKSCPAVSQADAD